MVCRSEDRLTGLVDESASRSSAGAGQQNSVAVSFVHQDETCSQAKHGRGTESRGTGDPDTVTTEGSCDPSRNLEELIASSFWKILGDSGLPGLDKKSR